MVTRGRVWGDGGRGEEEGDQKVETSSYKLVLGM